MENALNCRISRGRHAGPHRCPVARCWPPGVPQRDRLAATVPDL